MSPTELLAALRLALIGLLGFVAVNQLLLALWHRHDRIHRWIGLAALNAAVFTVARWWHHRYGAGDVDFPVRVQYTTLLLLQPLALGWAASLVARRPRSVARWQLVGLAVAALPWAGDLLLSGHDVIDVDALGSAGPTRRLQPLAAVFLIPYVLASVVVAYRTARRIERTRYTGALRRMLIASAVVVGGAVINDLLLVLGVLATLRVVDLALAVPVIGASYVVARRAADLFNGLEAAVVERTHELERANRGLAEALGNVRSLIDGIPDGVLVAREGVIVLANRAAYAAFGRPAGTLIGARLDALVVDEERPQLAALIASAARTAPGELRFVGADGATWVGEIACLALTFEGAPSVIAIVRDVDERHRLQRHLLLGDRLASLGTLAAGVAHEINNPLTYVLGNLEAIREDTRALAAAPSDELRDLILEALTAAEDGALRVRDIVQDMRTFARSDGGEATAVELDRTIASSLNLVRNEIRHRAALVTELAPVPAVVASEGRLSQVLVNLLVNAAQAVDGVDGPREIRVRTSVRDARVVVEVIDSGRGLTAEARARAFDPFFTTKPVGQGTGLGLSICHSIVTGFGGTIELLPRTDGPGTIARVTLRAASTARAGAAGPTAPTSSDDRRRVLVIDDERQVRSALRRMLDRHDVTLAAGGREALVALERDHFDAIVCDLMMPGMSGIELFDQLRARSPEQACRVIFVTGGAFTEDARRFLDQVPNPRLDKPLDPTRLRAAVHAVAA